MIGCRGGSKEKDPALEMCQEVHLKFWKIIYTTFPFFILYYCHLGGKKFELDFSSTFFRKDWKRNIFKHLQNFKKLAENWKSQIMHRVELEIYKKKLKILKIKKIKL